MEPEAELTQKQDPSVPPFVSELRESIGHSLLVLASVSGAVFDDQDRLLMIRHANDGKWGLPGGIIEPDEAPETRVVEEMREEVGLEVEPLRILAAHGGPECRVSYANGDLVSYVFIAYECAVKGGTLRADGVEALEVGYFSEQEVERLSLSSIGRAETRLVFESLK